MKARAETERGARTRALYEHRLAPVARQVDARLVDEADKLPAELRDMYGYAVGGGMRFRPCLMYLAYLVCSAGIDGEGGRDGGDGCGSCVGIDNLIQLASANYAALGGMWARLSVERSELAAFAGRSAWVIVPGVGVVCGVMMYLINAVPYRIGLRTLDRTRRR